MAPRPARVEIVRETIFDTVVEDPYRWMEDWKSDELQAYTREQADHARAFLSSLPDRDVLLQRIAGLGDLTPALSAFAMTAGRTFYLRRNPGDDTAKLVARLADDAPEQVLFDPSTVEGEAHISVDWYYPSTDGRFVAFGISPGGSEDSVLHILEVDTGRLLDERISRTILSVVSWLDDGRSFVYLRFNEMTPDTPITDRFRNARVYLHRLGTDPEEDVPVFGRGVGEGVEVSADDIPMVFLPPRSSWMIGVPLHGVLNELTLFVAPRSALANLGGIRWTKICDVEDGVSVTATGTGGVGFAVAGDTIYLRTHRDAPRYRVLATDLRAPDVSGATVVVPESRAVIRDMGIAGSYLLIVDTEAGISSMRRVPLEGGEIEEIPLPFDGTIAGWASQADSGAALVSLTSWIVSPRLLRYDPETNTLRDTGWIPRASIDLSGVEHRLVEAPADDGTMIPLTLIHRKNIALDGSNPTMLSVYGSYGISFPSAFAPQYLAWYERGGVLAVAHVRGGGEHGRDWHLGGHKLNKENTITDFIACAEWLIAQGYTRPDRLAGRGGSAGGIPTGGALVRRPDLWASMVMNVALTDALRFEVAENGPPNVPEFGSASTEEGFRALQIIDSYRRVVDDTPYPAVLLTTGVNDPRIVLWMATKMTARLQAATSSGKPVLMRVEYQGGHGLGSTKRQRDEELADTLAFLLNELGVTTPLVREPVTAEAM